MRFLETTLLAYWHLDVAEVGRYISKRMDPNIKVSSWCSILGTYEDHFDFSELDNVIRGARKHNLHLAILWFGAFKNGE